MTSIVRFIPETGNWEVLKDFDSYVEADNEYDNFCNLYPHAWIEILPEDEVAELYNN